jgi:solute carrier family 25 carnitine/acylcarnitine transporter 20/29
MQTNQEYKNALTCFKNTVQTQGPLSLYKGSLSPFIGFGICNAVVFSANGYLKRLLTTFQTDTYQGCNDTLSIAKIMIAGGSSGAIVAVINCPFELVKVKLQTSNNAYKNVIDCGLSIFKQQGIRGLYRGFPITFARDIPSYATYFGMYEGVKRGFKASDIEGKWTLLVAGGLAGIGAWLPGYPQDLVKSRIQFSTGPYSTLDVFKQTYKSKGLNGFFRGLTPTLVRAVPVNAAVFYVYEWAINKLT